MVLFVGVPNGVMIRLYCEQKNTFRRLKSSLAATIWKDLSDKCFSNIWREGMGITRAVKPSSVSSFDKVWRLLLGEREVFILERKEAVGDIVVLVDVWCWFWYWCWY